MSRSSDEDPEENDGEPKGDPDGEKGRTSGDGLEVHGNVFIGATSIGGVQNLAGFSATSGEPERSLPSRVWAVATVAWAMCPMVAWSTLSMSESLPGRLAELSHSATPYVVLLGVVAALLDVAAYFLYQRWTVARRVINDPVTWKIRLVAALVGGLGLGALMFLNSREPRAEDIRTAAPHCVAVGLPWCSPVS
ncbi:hypothetical protein [Streptomyces sp. Da 82-17]|uniref:hypothetical protein n=1 Tax=Streptomyces sp. Da 82-17 TaxID=3377116 RepID=UPI0038D3F544